MFPTWLFDHDVPATHAPILEALAAGRTADVRAAWAANPASSDAFQTEAYTKLPVKALHQLTNHEQGPMSDTVVAAVLRKKRAAVTKWVAASRDLSTSAALSVAAADPKFASLMLRGNTSVLADSALTAEVAGYATDERAAWWMLTTGDFTNLERLDMSGFRTREGVALRAMLCAEFPDKFDWLRSGGRGGDWFAAGSPYLTPDIAAECAQRTDWTLLSSVWNPRLSLADAERLVDEAPFTTAGDLGWKLRDAITMRRENYPQEACGHYSAESDEDVLSWVVRRTSRTICPSARLPFLGLLTDNPHMCAAYRQTLFDGLYEMWEQLPPRVALNLYARFDRFDGVDRSSADPLLDQTPQRPVHPPNKAWPGTSRDLSGLRLDYVGGGRCVDYLCEHLPADPDTWTAADALWGQDPSMTLGTFAEVVRAVA